MSIETRHPDYLDAIEDYRVMRDSYAGERKIKEATFTYLPPTAGQIKDGAAQSVRSPGWVSYTNYLARANFPEFVREAVQTLVGVMHAEPPIIELPAALEPMRKVASRKGESLEMLLRRINEQQLLFGRIGLLADFPQDPFRAERAEAPHLVEYKADSIINWDDERFTEFSGNTLNFVVVNETAFVRGTGGDDIFEWNVERRFRAVILEPENPEEPESGTNPLVYKTFTERDGLESETITPMFRGRTLDQIPFAVIGANDLNLTPDEIPLLPLARLCLAIYRGEADYRQSLHMQGQDTLVIIGDEIKADGQAKEDDEETEVGSGAIIRIAAGEGAKAEFIGVDSRGIPEQREALVADMTRAQSMGAKLLEPRGSQAESGDALRIRVAASTASLAQIALTGAAGLERILRMCATWVGADPDEVKVRPNMDFTQETPSPELARQLGEALKSGRIPLSAQSVHQWLQRKNFTKMTFDEEVKLIAADEAHRAAFQQAPKIVGRTAEADGHAHSYMLIEFPDGSVYGITDVADGHFHVIKMPGRTELSDKHMHALLDGQPLEEMQAPGEDGAEDQSEDSPDDQSEPPRGSEDAE